MSQFYGPDFIAITLSYAINTSFSSMLVSTHPTFLICRKHEHMVMKNEVTRGGGQTNEDDRALMTDTDNTWSDGKDSKRQEGVPTALRYVLTEIPPIPVCLTVALQHVLVSLGPALATSTVVSDAVCADLQHSLRARLLGTTLAMQGICTIAQTLIGVRLPVFQGASSSFLVPVLAISTHRDWLCPENNLPSTVNTSALVTVIESDFVTASTLSMEERLQQLSGSLMLSSLLEIIVGSVGLVRPLLGYIGPLTVGCTIALIGISLYELPVMYAKYNPVVTIATTVLVLVFALYMSKVQVPMPACNKKGGFSRQPIFQLLPVLLAMLVMWLVCALLTHTDVIPDDVNHPFYYSRTDSKSGIITNTPWFLIPYPGQFGPPSFSAGITIGFSAAAVSSLLESVGDYFAASKCCHVMPPPDHAISRGLLVEGLGSVMSGWMGAAHATTSYSVNIAILSLTKTASRSVLVLAGIILLTLSIVGKFGAILATMPSPILGGSMLVTLGMLTMLGITTLSYADMSTYRNMLITGVAFLVGLSVPGFVRQHRNMLKTGNSTADQMIEVSLGTPMFLGGVVAFILDNTVAGTEEERGFAKWKESHSSARKTDVTITVSSPDNTEKENGDIEEGKTPASAETELDHNAILSEGDVYGFRCLRHGFLGQLCKYLPFMPSPALAKEM